MVVWMATMTMMTDGVADEHDDVNDDPLIFITPV